MHIPAARVFCKGSVVRSSTSLTPASLPLSDFTISFPCKLTDTVEVVLEFKLVLSNGHEDIFHVIGTKSCNCSLHDCDSSTDVPSDGKGDSTTKNILYIGVIATVSVLILVVVSTGIVYQSVMLAARARRLRHPTDEEE